jgi:hypothetical protein
MQSIVWFTDQRWQWWALAKTHLPGAAALAAAQCSSMEVLQDSDHTIVKLDCGLALVFVSLHLQSATFSHTPKNSSLHLFAPQTGDTMVIYHMITVFMFIV